MTWKKQNIRFESVLSDKKKVSFAVILIITSFFIFAAGYLKIHSLQEEKKRHELELIVLRQSDTDAKKMADLNTEKLRRLNARVDNIISSDNETDYQVLGVSSVSAVASEDTHVNSSNNTSVGVSSYSITSTPIHSAFVIGKIEIYDPVRKTVDVYKDATTISQVLGAMAVGDTVDYYRKTSGWYQIQLENKAAWVNEKNVHELK
ncbi:MAG: SH3 domain-containing protein [Bacteroidia bacterium]|nr:MAG: SH3 domain-containing protein [Bacteroidia bacterium]